MACIITFVFLLIALLLYQVHCLKSKSGCPLKKYLSNPVNSTSNFECFKYQCALKPNCGVCFNSRYKKCFLLLLSWQVITWDVEWDQRVIRDLGSNVLSMWGNPPKNTVSRQPTVLWMLDEFSKGINFGKATHFLDIAITQVSTVEAGPRPSSTLKFARSTTSIKRSLFQKTTLLFDFSDQFTIAMWINTKSLPAGNFVLIDTVPKAGFKLMLFPEGEHNSLAFGTGSMLDGGDYISTKKNNTKVNIWRHIAMVSYSNIFTRFYLEGYEWPIAHWLRRAIEFTQPVEIRLWSDGGKPKFQYKGCYACVAMFQTALRAEDVRALRENCP